MTFSISIPGSFNVENAMAAILLCRWLGVPAGVIADGLKDARAKGRMEVFENKERKVVVISDYAHNILSFEKLYEAVREDYPGWRVEGLFGCPGGKGLSRRTELPEAVAKYADFVWVTEEDPGLDDVSAICRTLQENLAKHGCPCEIVEDREEAVRRAIMEAKPKTVIVMTGKGREEYMHRGNDYVPIESDSAMAERFLAE
jgi:UDP-N-acetylmuramoyl-L-alanyl-D-glutamate--2,6-diaminopimelate ligase